MATCKINFDYGQLWAIGTLYAGLFVSNKTGGFYYVVDHKSGLVIAKFKRKANARALVKEILDHIPWFLLTYVDDMPVLTAHESDLIDLFIGILSDSE